MGISKGTRGSRNGVTRVDIGNMLEYFKIDILCSLSS